jgi:beta-phosphoglucomutase family hydrolase
MSSWFAIFDWDGVIVDSSRQHEAAWECMAREENRPLPPGYFRRSFGMRNENVIPELLHWTTDPAEIRRLSLRKEEFFRQIIRSGHLEPLPGVREWLSELQKAGIPCAVASSTPRANIECVIETLGVRPFFRVLVCGEDVTRGKPDPEVFLLAAARLGAPPARCVVFEDAHVGIEAGRKAGMRVVGVATTHAAETLRGADLVVSRLSDLRLAEIALWFR